jgi:hypothetical protein
MVEVKFSKQWRGHDPGTVVELTDERAKQLISEGYCKSTSEPEKKKRGRPAKKAEPVVEVTPEPQPETKAEPLGTEP